MTQKSSQSSAPAQPAPVVARRPYQPPQIVLTRELKALAQGLGPFSGTGGG